MKIPVRAGQLEVWPIPGSVLDTWPAWGFPVLVLAGVAAGFVNVVAGGGSLLTLPLLVYLGVPPSVANGTTRLPIVVQNIVAVVRYARAGQVDFRLARRLAPPALLGCGAGVALAVDIGDAGFRTLLGWVMLGCAALVAASPSPPARVAQAAGGVGPGWLRVALVGTVIGFYGGLVQAGVGYLILFALTAVLRLPLFTANVMKVVVVAIYMPLALALFFAAGKVLLMPALALSLGQAIGAWLGAGAALERGVTLIRWMLALVVAVSAVDLLVR